MTWEVTTIKTICISTIEQLLKLVSFMINFLNNIQLTRHNYLKWNFALQNFASLTEWIMFQIIIFKKFRYFILNRHFVILLLLSVPILSVIDIDSFNFCIFVEWFDSIIVSWTTIRQLPVITITFVHVLQNESFSVSLRNIFQGYWELNYILENDTAAEKCDCLLFPTIFRCEGSKMASFCRQHGFCFSLICAPLWTVVLVIRSN